ncbi:hypothetical protein KQI42_16550 [Tissierella sp. MSJ-40]|uniref:Uncharacterized protein n=1 Tax=Tissierella simiarum TaxID=2841534 RepID=A0ABS6EAR3_9FIRM|nr:hypothetical protein [Tissierella simiarum]MBU5439626.1 hypothetical protein [Tissierella simiarum]
MKNFKVISIFLAITLVICGFSLPLYADSNDELLKGADENDFVIEVIS